MKLAIVGSRAFFSRDLLFETVDKYEEKLELIISGGAIGADSLAQEYAQSRGIPILIIYPRWYVDGELDKGAGFKRNQEIVEAATHVLAFWDGASRGTENSLSHAKRLNKPSKVVLFQEPLKHFYFVDGKTHPLSVDSLCELVVQEKKWQSARQAFTYFASKALDQPNEKLLSLDLTKANDLRKLDKAAEALDLSLLCNGEVQRYYYRINLLKFEQNPALKELLLATKEPIVYADDNRFLGIGIKKTHPRIVETEHWGTNILGKILTQLRDEFQKAVGISD